MISTGDPNAQVASELSAGATYNASGNYVGSLDEKLTFIHTKHTIIVVPPKMSRECTPQTYPCYLTLCDSTHSLVGDKTYRVDHGELVILEQDARFDAGSSSSSAQLAAPAESPGLSNKVAPAPLQVAMNRLAPLPASAFRPKPAPK